MYIYKIENLITGKRYIGQTKRSLDERWNEHIRASRNSNSYLYKAMRKYGVGNFIIRSIVRCSSIDELNSREKSLIRIYNTMLPNGYNMMTGGNKNTMSPVIIEKIRQSLIGRHNTYWLGKKLPDEVKHKISQTKLYKRQSCGATNPMYGKTHTIESIRKNCLSNGGGRYFEVIISGIGIRVGIWDNKKKCSRDLGISRECIRGALNGRLKTIHGYIIRYCTE